MDAPHRVGDDIFMVPSFAAAPGLGYLPINAFAVLGSEPVLIDTGIPKETKDWLEALWSIVDPSELRWVVLTHEDRDHSGKLQEVLEAAPNARLVINFVGLAKLAAEVDFDLPPEKLFIVNPGQALLAGDRRFAVVRPPVYDSSATIGLIDEKSGTLFAVDAFGALIPEPAIELGEVPEDAYAMGFTIFNLANSAWLSSVDEDKFARVLDTYSQMGLRRILSTHLPVAEGGCEKLIERLGALAGTELPAELPDDAAYRAIVAEAKGAGGIG
jgi:hypothetical protein